MLYVEYAFGGARSNMSYLIDDVARTLASPMPRRKAFRYLAGVVGGALMATIGAQRASAASCSPACTGGAHCCTSGGTAICCASTEMCCLHGGTVSCCGSGTCCVAGTGAC